MTEFQFECRSTKREAEDLMSETNSEDRFLTHQVGDGFVRVGQSRRIARTVREKNPVGILRERLFGRRRCGNNRDPESFLPKQSKNFFFNPLILTPLPKRDRSP